MLIRKIGFSLLILLSFMLSSITCFAIDKTATFRVITEEFPPYNYTSNDGNIVGISTEIVREILKRTGHPDNIEVMPWSDGYRITQQEDNILLFSTTRTPAREELFKWVGPMVPNNLAFFARKDSGLSITSIEEAKKVTSIGVYKDDFGEQWLKENGFNNLDAVMENSRNVPKLLNGEIDLWIANELTGKHMIAKAGATGSLEKIYDVQKDYMFIAFSKNTSDAVIERWQKALDDIKSDGSYAQIFSQWIMFSYTEDLKPETQGNIILTASEQAWIDQHPVIRMAPDPDYAPFQFKGEDGFSKGVADDYLKLIGQKLGIRFEPKVTDSWGESLQLVQQHEADLVAVAARTAEREEYMRFTAPYVEFPDVIITRTSHPELSSLKDLHEGTIASVEGFAINKFINQQHPDINLVMAADVKGALQMVSLGEADASVMNIATTSYTIEKWNITNLRINEMAGFSYKLAFASRRDWPMLNQILDKALDAISDNEKREILRKWIAITPDKIATDTKLTFTSEEQNWLDENPIILAGSDPSWPPMEFLDDEGGFDGMVADYMELVEQRLGVQIKIMPQESWSDALKSAQNRDVSILTAAVRTPERDQYMLFTQPYLELPAAIIVNNKTEGISSMADLRGKRVAVVKDYGTHDFLKRGFPYLEISAVPDIKSGLYDVSYGNADAFIANIASASYFIEKNAIQNLRIAGESGYVFELGIASRNDSPVLNQILEKGLASITSESRQEIYRKWIGLKADSWRPTKEQLIALFAIVALLLIIGVLFWTVILKRTVKTRTIELEESLARSRAILESTTDGILVIDKEGAIYSFNQKFQEIWHIPESIVNSKKRKALTDYAMSQLQDPQEFFNKIIALDNQPNATSSDILKFNDGRIVEQASLPQQIGREYVGRVWSFRDITQQRKAEESLKSAMASAENANRAKSDFLATMSHEMRTPMNAVLGMTHLALQQDIPPKLQDYLNSIQMAGRSLLGIISDTLDLSKIEAGHLELEQVDFDLDRVLEGTAVVAGHQALENGLDFNILMRRDVPRRFIGDPQRLGQILLNLSSNAVKFTETGKVEINISVTERTSEKICLRFAISDTGIGLSEEQTHLIFDAFTQADSSTTRRYGGTGLGLSISGLLIDKMDGTLEVESEPGQGSTFSFTAWLELTDNENRKADETINLKSNQLLLASSQFSNLCVLAELLERAGASVISIDNAGRAMAGYSEGELPFSLILLDIRNGHEHEWHTLHPLLPLKAKVLLLADNDLQLPPQDNVTLFHGAITPFSMVRAVARALGQSVQEFGDELTYAHHAISKGQRVLLVEDNIMNQQVGSGLLEEYGINVTIASDGSAALKALAEDNFDLVLMDIQMPGMNGYEVTENLRQIPGLEQLPVIAMTAHAMEDARLEAMDSGMNDFITKPIEPERLYTVLSQYLEMDEYIPATETELEKAAKLLGNLPGIDIKQGLHHTGGNVELYKKLLREFKLYNSSDGEVLKSLIVEQEEEEARRMTHTLKGIAGNLGASELQLICRKIEEQLPDKVTVEQLDALVLAHHEVLDGISQLDVTVTDSDNIDSVELTDWAVVFNSMSNHLMQGNMRVNEQLPALKKHLAGRHPELTGKLEEQLNQFHFDAALQTLNKIDTLI